MVIFIILKGMMLGLFLAMMIGPVFFALLRTSIDKGFTSGAFLAFGIFLSELAIVATVYTFLAQLEASTVFQRALGYVGGVIMMIFGIAPFIRPMEQKKFIGAKASVKTRGIRYIIEGFLFNIMNPFVYIFWIFIISTMPTELGIQSGLETYLFLLCIILTVLTTDLLKAYIAHFITKFLTMKVIATIDKGAGIILFLFGIRLIIFAITGVGGGH